MCRLFVCPNDPNWCVFPVQKGRFKPLIFVHPFTVEMGVTYCLRTSQQTPTFPPGPTNG